MTGLTMSEIEAAITDIAQDVEWRDHEAAERLFRLARRIAVQIEREKVGAA